MCGNARASPFSQAGAQLRMRAPLVPPPSSPRFPHFRHAVTSRVTPRGDVIRARATPSARLEQRRNVRSASLRIGSVARSPIPSTPACCARGQGSRWPSPSALEPATSTVLGGPMPLHVKTMTAEKQLRPPDHRRSNKPIMEKRRRARINNCLGELKGLILEAMKKDPARHSKLEKADILEMTVKHLQSLQRQQMAIAVATDPTVMTKFRSGFNECATEVARYVNRIDGVDRAVRQRLIGHLRSCITGLSHLNPAAIACLMPGLNPGSAGTPPFVSPFQPMHVQVPSASAALNVFSQVPFSVATDAPSRVVGGLNLIPSRLPNGDLAFVLPNQQQNVNRATAGANPDPMSAGQRLASGTDLAAPLLQPAFPSATVTSGERRTPSAFTPLAGAPGLRPASPAYGCNVTSTTSPNSVTFSPASGGFDEVAAAALPVKTEEDVDERFRAVCSLASTSVKVSPDSAAKSELQALNQVEAYDLSKPSTSQVCSMAENDKMWRPW